MKRAHDIFVNAMNDMDSAETLYNHIHDIANIPIKIDFILRWQWVQSVSAFDKLIHDLIRIGMIEIFQGKRQPTSKYNAFTIDMSTYNTMIGSHEKIVSLAIAQNILEQRIVLVQKQFSYQDPQKVADGLSYIWNEKNKWKIVADYLGMSDRDCKTQLNNISIRRNQIVHQSDYPDSMSEPQEIYIEDILEIKTFIKSLGVAIYNIVKL